MVLDILIPIIAGLGGSIIGVFGSRWIFLDQTRRQKSEERQKHIQDQLMAYDTLWRFLKECNNRWQAHPASTGIKQYTHWFTLDSYEWLRKHFEQSGNLLTSETFSIYLDLLKKDTLGMSALANGKPNPFIMANYMKLQDDAEQMCAKLQKNLDNLTKSHNGSHCLTYTMFRLQLPTKQWTKLFGCSLFTGVMSYFGALFGVGLNNIPQALMFGCIAGFIFFTSVVVGLQMSKYVECKN